jgi:hypothetical protein
MRGIRSFLVFFVVDVKQIYPFQIVYVLLFALAYMIFMWSWYGATDEYVPLLLLPVASAPPPQH